MIDFIVFIAIFSLTTFFFCNGIILVCNENYDDFFKAYIGCCAGLFCIALSLCSYVGLYIAVEELLK